MARPAASAAETLDPASSLSAYEYLGALYNRLVRLDEQGRTIPDLAEDWSASADATTWTFRLRRDVRFHDGIPLHGRRRHRLDRAHHRPGHRPRRAACSAT
ncbi:ABC transporter substrate-binding protein [Clavibacter zhangzhiyongii]|uniref:ABC transporter substrate-binding protein n=1 Tax=Clavibacter zhangzhiyongii TaxID=2768071 RepID=UPI0039E08D43